MAELGAVLEQLKRERLRLEGELRQLNQAIKALARVTGGSSHRSSNTRRPRRSLSTAARKRIAAAQRARWAKFHARAAKKAA